MAIRPYLFCTLKGDQYRAGVHGKVFRGADVFEKPGFSNCFGHFGPLVRPMEGHVDFNDTNFSRRSHPCHPELLPLSRMSKSYPFDLDLAKRSPDHGLRRPRQRPTKAMTMKSYKARVLRNPELGGTDRSLRSEVAGFLGMTLAGFLGWHCGRLRTQSLGPSASAWRELQKSDER